MSAATLIPPATLEPDALETARQHHAQNHLLAAAQAYRQTLESNPQSQPALLGLSLIARQSNQFEPALRMAQAALAAGPTHALAWANYGDLLLAARQLAQALQSAQSAYRRALQLDPHVAAAHYGLANTLALQADRPENYALAFPHFETAALLAPHIPEFHFALAYAHGRLGRHALAIAAYRRAVQLRPRFASAWLNLGVELIADGRDDLAEPCYRQALAAAQSNPSTQIPTQVSAQLNLGHLHRGRRNFPAAQAHYQSALGLASASSPTRLAEVHIAFTYLHLEQHHFPEAWQSLQAAQAAQQSLPQPNPEIPNVRGILLLAEDSQTRVPQVSTLRPGSDAGPIDHLHQAILAFEEAEAHGHKTAPSNRGNALLRLGRVQEAIEAHRTALALDPHHPGVRYNLALTQLRAGNFREGWQNYEIRWQFREVHPRPRRFPQPRWQGEALPGGSTLFLYAEQGLGDTLQFLRYLPKALERLQAAPRLDFETGESETGGTDAPGAQHLAPDGLVTGHGFSHADQARERNRALAPEACSASDASHREPPQLPPFDLILEVQPPLARLIRQSIPNWESVHRPDPTRAPTGSSSPLGKGIAASASRIQILSQGDPLPPFTHHVPLMSLPAVFQTTPETIPTPIPYLFSPANAGAPPSIPSLDRGWDRQPPKIGLHWAGNPNYRADRERSTQLPTFLPLLEIPDIHWISLQKGPAAAQIAQIPPELRPCDASSSDRDLAGTAALIAQLDLVLTTDSAVAHLAGALGKPLWLLLPWQSDWRWMQHRLDTPWYPQARLFRQCSPHNWPELIHRVARELKAWLAQRIPPAQRPR